MKNEILINDVLKDLDELILKFDSYYTLKNLKGKSYPKTKDKLL